MTEPWIENLNAYLDGELSPVARADFERALAADPKLAGHLVELQKLTSLLQSLPRVSAPARTIRGMLYRLVRSDRTLIDAYVDNELGEKERRIVEKYLLDKPSVQRTIANRAQTRDALGALPRLAAPEDSQARLLQSLANEIDSPDLSSSDAIPANTSEPRIRRRPYHELLTAYLDDELSPSVRSSLDKKLRESENARRVLAELQSLRSLLKDLPRQSVGPELSARINASLRNDASNAQPWTSAEEISAASHARPVTRKQPERYPLVYRLAGWAIAAGLILAGILTLPRVRDASVDSVASQGEPREKTLVVSTQPTAKPFQRKPEPSEVRPESTVPEVAGVEDTGNRDLPIEGLSGLSLAELSQLDGGIIRLWCKESKPAIDRLWIVLNDNEASIRSTTEKSASRGTGTTIEASVSPAQLAEILRDLIYAEQNRQLFAQVDVENQLPVDATQRDAPKHQLVARIETTNPVAMPLLNTKPPKEPAAGPLFPPRNEAPAPKAPEKPPPVVQKPPVEAPLPTRITLRFVLETGS